MKSNFRFLALLFLSLLCSNSSHAQTYTMGREEFISWEEFLSEYFDSIIEDDDANNTLRKNGTLELLEELRNRPLNLNTAQRNELLQLPFLTEAQADSIIKYREQKHLLRSLGELQWITGIPYSIRCQLSLFTYAGDTVQASTPLLPRFYQGKHELTTRFDVPLYQRAGDRKITEEEMATRPNLMFMGNRLAQTMRYRYHWQQNVAYGLTLQKDSGEPFAAHHNYPYDYTSAFVYFRPQHQRYSFWLGDYNLHFGQGLLLGHSFFYGPLQLLGSNTGLRSRVRPHTSSDESDFFRGAAANIQLGKKAQIIVFASFRKLDGRIKDDSITSIKTDGLHRTITEINRKRVVGNGTLGGRFNYRNDFWTIGANAYYCFYNKTISPSHQEYNKYYLRGKSAGGLSTDYTWKHKKWSLQGETAADMNLHLATTNTVRYASNDNTSFILQQRSFSTRFVSPYGNTLQENSRIQNEHALLLGSCFPIIRPLLLTAYCEYFYHPRPTFRTDLPAHGIEGFLQAQYSMNPKLRFTIRYKTKVEQQNITGYDKLMQYVGTHRGRISCSYNVPRFIFNAAIDATAVTRQTDATTLGWMFSSRSRYHFSQRFTGHIFASLFFTDDYASRLYAYEPQLQYAASFPTFAYHGARMAGILQWKFHSKGYVAIRYGWLHYFNREKISSGTQEIDSSSKNDLSLQLGWKF